MRLTPSRAAQILRYLGPSWALYRLKHALQLRSGLLRRKLPMQPWSARPLAHCLTTPGLADPTRYAHYRREEAPAFFFSTDRREQAAPILRQWDNDGSSVVAQADAHLAGTFTYFSHHSVHTGIPPNWHRNPFGGQEAPTDHHWSTISDFAQGDIKLIWELSRFSFVYDLVRAYWRTGDERYPHFFWQILEDWREHNPPQQGVNWKCGQETSFRLMAWIFGLYGFQDSPASTPERLVMLAQMVAVSAERVEGHIDYALSQRNNHGISEGMGLWTVGLLFPEFRQAAVWRERGRQVLESLAQELLYSDGAFSQHSVNYHRLMLHDYFWAIRLGEVCGEPLSDALRQQVAKAVDLLYQMQDEQSGQVPLYGQNDGALILPLNNCDYLDFRPVTQTGHYLCHGARAHPPGAWDEDLFWLWGEDALGSPVDTEVRTDLRTSVSGYYTLRAKDGFVMTRCASYRDRPGQADMLHVDLWRDGENIAMDAGTYSYNAPSPWNNPLAGSAYHNTVTVDGLDQMDRVSKFLWLPWLRSQQRAYALSPNAFFTYWEGSHNGYTRLADPVRHRRGILRIGDDAWLVVDRLFGSSLHSYRLHWLLADLPYQWDRDGARLVLTTGSGPYALSVSVVGGKPVSDLVRADSENPRGWHAPYYMARKPALSLAVQTQADSCFFWTLFAPPSIDLQVTKETISVHHPNAQIQLVMAEDATTPLIRSVDATGSIQDHFLIL